MNQHLKCCRMSYTCQPTNWIPFFLKEANLVENSEINIVNEYTYVGIFWSRRSSFTRNKKYLAEQANKAHFALFKKTRNLNLSIDMQIELLNKIAKPILLYGSEIWVFGNFDDLDRIQLNVLKYVHLI